MSDINLITPLLEGYSVGAPISDHDGIVCCPAIKEITQEQYIVKVISIPASQVQMDALLLAGAYKDPADAMDYFRQQSEEIMSEAESLQKLSLLDGFLSYDAWQTVPITRHRLGYQVYLIGSFKHSLDKYVRQNAVTHLEAINLGLDLCSALSACRRFGAIYVDLKPTNIFITEQKEYKIGDLGFVSLDALNYTVIPDKYRSVYTPPELFDPMSSLNMTVDTYAVGMILYQLFNDGQLPFKEKAPQEVLPSPVNADYELADIIMRAIHPDPFQRWNDPKDLGQALVEYMQRNVINNDPITVHTPLDIPAEPLVPEAAAKDEDNPGGKTGSELLSGQDETVPDEADAETLLPHEMSDELSKMVSKADDLISHQAPVGVILPDIPDPPDPFAFAANEDDTIADSEIPEDPFIADADASTGKASKVSKGKSFISPEILRRNKKIRTGLTAGAIALAVGTGGLWYYNNVFQLVIHGLSIETGKSTLAVTINSDVSDKLLTVLCTDSSGNVVMQPVQGGKAEFTGLKPDSTYVIELQPQGFHAVSGETKTSIATNATTNITSFSGLAGTEDGSVILSFTVEGDEPEEWMISIEAEGEEPRVQSFTGHSTTVSNLTVGKTYLFTLRAANLQADSSVSVSGETTLEYLACRLILAQDITLYSDGNGSLTVRWSTPGDIIVDSWNVRCFNENGYDQDTITSETEATFNEISADEGYTIEITAAGMSQPSVLDIPNDSILISGFAVTNGTNVSDSYLSLEWNCSDVVPDGGWQLSYSLDGNRVQDLVTCSDSYCSIHPRVPGATYSILLNAANGTTVLNNTLVYTCPKAQDFDENKLSAENIEANLLKTPEKSWNPSTVTSEAFSDQFVSGDKLSVLLHGTTDFYRPASVSVDVLYVIRNAQGNVLPDHLSSQTMRWNELWSEANYHYGSLDIPSIPNVPGEYTFELYFNGKTVASLPFHIS